jgi:hypothetical protein
MIRSLKIIYLLTPFFIIIPEISLACHYQVIPVVDSDTIVIKYGGKYVDLILKSKDSEEIMDGFLHMCLWMDKI